MKVYISSSIDNTIAVAALAELVRSKGNFITFAWWDVTEKIESYLQAKAYADTEIQGVKDADLVIFVPPGGRGAHVELGAALGLGIPVVGLKPRPEKDCLFYNHTKMDWIHPQQLTDYLASKALKNGI